MHGEDTKTLTDSHMTGSAQDVWVKTQSADTSRINDHPGVSYPVCSSNNSSRVVSLKRLQVRADYYTILQWCCSTKVCLENTTLKLLYSPDAKVNGIDDIQYRRPCSATEDRSSGLPFALVSQYKVPRFRQHEWKPPSSFAWKVFHTHALHID